MLSTIPLGQDSTTVANMGDVKCVLLLVVNDYSRCRAACVGIDFLHLRRLMD